MRTVSDNLSCTHSDVIEDFFECLMISPGELDLLLEKGFRHFGTLFFRYNTSPHENETFHVIPLRINLENFQSSRSQKRIFSRNRDIEVVFRDACIDGEKERLFEIHRKRFKENIPASLYDFLSHVPAIIPCRTLECCFYLERKLIAAGFMDVGDHSTSCVYTIFDTAYAKRSLGIFMILQQVQYSLERGMSYVYHGYAYKENSVYDYKKNFHGLECFDWAGNWNVFRKQPS